MKFAFKELFKERNFEFGYFKDFNFKDNFYFISRIENRFYD